MTDTPLCRRRTISLRAAVIAFAIVEAVVIVGALAATYLRRG